MAWGETVTGVKTCLATKENVVALTLDACGSPHGMGFDAELISYLEKEKIPATLFINARWIDGNPKLFITLAHNPLFTIANHGFLHKPASVSDRSIYGIEGTKNVEELIDEIGLNAEKIKWLTGKRPAYYRSGTAYYDETCRTDSRTSRSRSNRLLGARRCRRHLYRAAGHGRAADVHARFHRDPAHEPSGERYEQAGVKAAVPELRKRGVRFVHGCRTIPCGRGILIPGR